MDALDPEYIPYSLKELQKLNIRTVVSRRLIYTLKADIACMDGYRKDLRLKERPGKTGPPQRSTVEDESMGKQRIKDKLITLTRELKFNEVEMKEIIDSLEYRLREKEWRLLNDVYLGHFSKKDLINAYGLNWEQKLKKIFINYGVRSNEERCKKSI